jgi:hypothetical protein
MESDFNIREAFEFYRKFIFNDEQQELLTTRGFRVAGSVASVNWELFASILVNSVAKDGYGADLDGFEVKSAVQGGSFEYQYHLNGGKTKLIDDMQVDHIFISYSQNYKDIDVRILKGAVLKQMFESWMPGLIENYEGSVPRQRYRKSISYGFVLTHGDLIMSTRNGEMVSWA